MQSLEPNQPHILEWSNTSKVVCKPSYRPNGPLGPTVGNRQCGNVVDP